MDLGRAYEAREHLISVVWQRRSERVVGWAWALLGRTWEADDTSKALGMLLPWRCR